MPDTVISAGLLARLLAEAGASRDREVCGLLFGGPDRIDTTQATANVATDPATKFEIDPAALLAAYRSGRGGGPVVIGHYHSHPSGPAAPSSRDRAAAEPGRLWLILGEGEARLWLAGAADFEEVPLRMV